MTHRVVKVCGAYYNAAGEVIQVPLGFPVPDAIRPGESGTFNIPGKGEGVASYRLWLQGDPQ